MSCRPLHATQTLTAKVTGTHCCVGCNLYDWYTEVCVLESTMSPNGNFTDLFKTFLRSGKEKQQMREQMLHFKFDYILCVLLPGLNKCLKKHIV